MPLSQFGDDDQQKESSVLAVTQVIRLVAGALVIKGLHFMLLSLLRPAITPPLSPLELGVRDTYASRSVPITPAMNHKMPTCMCNEPAFFTKCSERFSRVFLPASAAAIEDLVSYARNDGGQKGGLTRAKNSICAERPSRNTGLPDYTGDIVHQ